LRFFTNLVTRIKIVKSLNSFATGIEKFSALVKINIGDPPMLLWHLKYVRFRVTNAYVLCRCRFETDNRIKVEEVGYLKPGTDGPVSVVQGGNSYVAPDGRVISTGYISDENGYRPVGDHLPTPPPIPFEIQESLRLLASLPSTPEPKYN
jgi:hypothetical protein